MNENKYLKYWIALSHLLEGSKLLTVFRNFADGEQAWRATEHDLLKIGLPAKTAQRVVSEKSKHDPDKLLEIVVTNNIQVATIDQDKYPDLLKNTSDPPALIYYRGNLPGAEKKLGVVGSRKLTAYSKTVGLTLTRELARNRINLVSGLARGIDSLAHQACIEQNTPTIAVVGTGLLTSDTYPTENKKLAEQIINQGGALISEYPPGSPPLQHHFPMRNRIIAGLSQGVLVISAAQKSGALITAYNALDENREVFAVPGQITDSLCAGSNGLLKRGAHVVTESEDVLKVMGWDSLDATNEISGLSETENIIYKLIEKNPIYIDEIAQNSELQKEELLTQITILELKGLIKDIGGKRYIRL